MGHPLGDSQRRLPIPLELVTPEIEIPMGDAIQLGEHPFPALLPGGGLGLFRRTQMHRVAENIDTWQGEGPVAAHGLSHRTGLVEKGVLLQHMAGEQQPVIPAPGGAAGRESGNKPLGDVIVILPADLGYPAIRQIPEYLPAAVPGRE